MCNIKIRETASSPTDAGVQTHVCPGDTFPSCDYFYMFHLYNFILSSLSDNLFEIYLGLFIINIFALLLLWYNSVIENFPSTCAVESMSFNTLP